MFSDVGWGEILVILVVAVVIFGPDRLPKLASDLARGIRTLRGVAQQARSEVGDELGPEFRNLDITALHPKTFARKALLDDDDDPLGLRRGDHDGARGNGASHDDDDDWLDDDGDLLVDDQPAEPATLAEPTSPEPGTKAPYDAEAT
ncbi:MAG: sec-independent translocase [Streptosporangiales bacterium]